MKVKADTLKRAYVGTVLLAYVHGEENALEAYQQVYARSPTNRYESDLGFIIRCAEQDFLDGPYQGAVYQEVYDALVGELA